MGGSVNSAAASAEYTQKSVQARTQGIADRKAAYARAYGLERDSAEYGHVAAQQLETMRQNQTAAVSATRVSNAASGFNASGGSKLRQEMSTAQILEEAIASAGESYAIQDQNARLQAFQLRKEGDDALKLADIMAGYYSRVFSANAKSVGWQLLGGTLSTIGDTTLKYNIGGAADAIRNWGAKKTQ